ncbi:hypothetical protein [Nonomuraea zeae]|uniref:Ferritin-like domain-containing protein n=1 Tax=Nonomuraea zeae TaxID=1642303 RepID=A0A5S4FCW7_9ACTN|nr:hypothetical protein [Nonomuraea zeae]TMR15831.1 hypothetical protein ETD85_55855 [Nonomuraea zeae]
MAFDPLQERGIPLDEQLRTWQELNVTPIDPDHADPHTRCRILTMNGVETEAIAFSHQLARHCPDLEIKRQLARVRYIEAQQQKAVGWLLPGVMSVTETMIAYEQAAVDLTAWVARMEPDPYLKQSCQFVLLEHVDHLYRYANLYELIEHREAGKVVGRLTEVLPGRPAYLQHRDPPDNVRQPYDRSATEPLSRLHVLTLMSAEQQLTNFLMNAGPACIEPVARALCQEIAMIGEEHVTHYETLADPAESWWERLLNHEYNECYLYYSFMETESDPRVKSIWELHLGMELEQLRLASELFSRFDGRDPDQVLAAALPPPVTFEPNKAYVRDLLTTQIGYTTQGTGYAREPHEEFSAMQSAIMGGGKPPSERVIDDNRAVSGQEYRLETEGPHPANLQPSR